MTACSKIALAFTALLITVPSASAAAKGLDSKAFSGTWQLNSAKSKFSSAQYAPKSDTRTYSVAGDRITMRSSMVAGDGKPMKWSYSARVNGHPYPVMGNRGSDRIMLTMAGPREFKAQSTLKGKPAAKSSVSVSADGKQLTVNRNLSTPKGMTDDVIVYDRVK